MATAAPETITAARGSHNTESNSSIPSSIPRIASLLIHNSSAQDFNNTAAVANFASATMLNTVSKAVAILRGKRSKVSISAPSINKFRATALLSHQSNGGRGGMAKGWRAISLINTLPSIGKDGLIWPNIHSASSARPKSISLPWWKKPLRQRARRVINQAHDVTLTANKAPNSAPALLDSKSMFELMRAGKYICKYSMLADNNMPRHRLAITLGNEPNRARNAIPA